MNKWIGPIKVLNVQDNLVFTNFGNFANSTSDKIIIGFTYLFRVNSNQIIEVGMSCADLVVFHKSLNGIEVLLIKRGKEPFKNMFAIPGGNMDENELPIESAIRELKEETGLVVNSDTLKNVGVYDKPWRDPRVRYCRSNVFTLLLENKPMVIPQDDAIGFKWMKVDRNGNCEMDIAFDHFNIIKDCFRSLKLG